MIKSIPQKYCKEEFTQLMINPLLTCLIMNAEEIILLKYGNKVLINKFTSHPMRNKFPRSNIEIFEDEENTFYKELFSYNHLYLGYRNKGGGIQFFQNYFVKEDNRCLIQNKSLPIFQKEPTITRIMNRKEIEEYFNPLDYDAMYIMDRNGIISYAYNKKDGTVIKTNLIPNDEQIIELDRKNRTLRNKVACMANENYNDYEKKYNPRNLEKIKNIKIFGGVIGNFADFLVTVKDSKFDVKWFSLHFLEKDKFQLDFSPIFVLETNQEDILRYAESNPIEEVLEPSIKRVLINKNN